MRWLDADQTLILADDGRTIPAVPGNRDFDGIDVASVLAFTPSPPTLSEFSGAIEAHVDDAAKSRNYASAVSLASYVQSTNAQWAAEAQAFVAWRDAAWGYAYGELAKVQAGQRAIPSVADLISELPAIAWPS